MTAVFPMMISAGVAAVDRSRGHVPQVCSSKNDWTMNCTERKENRTAIPGTTCSAPVAEAYPSEISRVLEEGIRNGVSISGIMVIRIVGMGSRSWISRLSLAIAIKRLIFIISPLFLRLPFFLYRRYSDTRFPAKGGLYGCR